MADRTFLGLALLRRSPPRAAELEAWAAAHLDHGDVDAACRAWSPPWARPGSCSHHSGGGTLDVRTLCLIRETLARHDGLADFAFAMQGLGTGRDLAVRHATSSGRWLPRRARARRFPPSR
jgi:acyl-CoA dehydrogenase